MRDRRHQLVRRIRLLTACTIGYNLGEAAVALTAGTLASSTALVAFGLDSTVEVASAAAVAWQFAARDAELREARERRSLRITAVSFFALAAYVTAEAVRSLAAGVEAEASLPGIVLSAVLLGGLLVRSRTRPGKSGARRRVAAATDLRGQGLVMVFIPRCPGTGDENRCHLVWCSSTGAGLRHLRARRFEEYP